MTLVVDSTVGFSGLAYGNPESLSPSGSPWSVTNTNAFLVTVIIMGGTVSLIEYQARTWIDAGTWQTLPGTAAATRLRPGDTLRVTYSVAPTATWFPT